MLNGRWTKLAVAVLVAAVSLGAFSLIEEVHHVPDLLMRADLQALGPALLLMVGAHFVRAARLSLLLCSRTAPSFALFSVAVLHAFFASLLPMRLGELSLVVLLRRRHGMKTASSLGVLIGTKALDFALLLTIGAIAVAWLLYARGAAGGLVLLSAGIGLAALVAFMALPMSIRGLRAIRDALAWRGWTRFAGIFDDLTSSYAGLNAIQLMGLQILTLIVWALFLTSFHLCGLAVEGTKGLLDSYAAAVAGSFAFISPVNGIAQFGPFEAAWVTTAHFVSGIEAKRALAAALLVHGATLGVSGLLALMVTVTSWLPAGGGAAGPVKH